jgi:hypothetical protein
VPRWGTEPWIAHAFGPHASAIAIERKPFVFRYASPEQFVTLFRAFYGPVHTAFLALDAHGQAALGSVRLPT